MYFCYEQMDADGNFKNVKVKKEKESQRDINNIMIY